MAGLPHTRIRFTTDSELLRLASTVPLHPAKDKAVFFAEDEGAELAADFVARDATYTRLPDLLSTTPHGRRLWSELNRSARPWSDKEEVWWELSWRLARAAKGIVHIFGPKRLVQDRPLSEFKHKFSTGSYANTVLEKVELPELEANLAVTAIYYNLQPFE